MENQGLEEAVSEFVQDSGQETVLGLGFGMLSCRILIKMTDMPAEYIYTLADLSQLPGLFNGLFFRGRREPRMAFVGRSNVGKSSLINALLATRIAYVSSEPGKTRAIHFFTWPDAKKILVDLPGYGYAKRPKEDRDQWRELIQAYLREDDGLERVVVLLDSRNGPSDKDLEAIDFFRSESIPMTFAMTKIDQLKNQSERAKRKREVEKALLEMGYGPELIHWISSKDKTGIKPLTRSLIEAGPPTVSRTE